MFTSTKRSNIWINLQTFLNLTIYKVKRKKPISTTTYREVHFLWKRYIGKKISWARRHALAFVCSFLITSFSYHVWYMFVYQIIHLIFSLLWLLVVLVDFSMIEFIKKKPIGRSRIDRDLIYRIMLLNPNIKKYFALLKLTDHNINTYDSIIKRLLISFLCFIHSNTTYQNRTFRFTDIYSFFIFI